ncbi:TetR/AcrR family transcriptional regulator [Sphingopyxis sp.]|uniref:TetR/AcrR family transcriptional regulator n=1 Tax=Sphingopyxis sp. TaxID=1908224 RepID=UPI003D11202A
MTATPRRTQAERSHGTQAKLAQAAYAVIAARGHTALRMAAVAEEAGVSQGALLHHFPDKNALTKAAIHHALAMAGVDSERALAKAPTDPTKLLDMMIADFRSFFFGDYFWVALGITLDANRNPDLAAQIGEDVGELRRPIYAAWAEKLASAGWQRGSVEEMVRSAAALISGLAVRKLWAPHDAISDRLIEDWQVAALTRVA